MKTVTLYQVGLDGKMTEEPAVEAGDYYRITGPQTILDIPKQYACTSPQAAALHHLQKCERRVRELKTAEAKLEAARSLAISFGIDC